MKEIRCVIGKDEAGKTIQSFALKTEKISASSLRSLKFSGGILLNGLPAHTDKVLHEGDELRFCFRENEQAYLPAHDIPVHIVYEDDDIMVIDKQAPLPTMYSKKQGGATLETGLYHHLHCPSDFLFRPVNRLDKGTSGLMVVAKHAHAQQLMQRMLHTDRFIREYTALCVGKMPSAYGRISAPIAKEEGAIKRIVHPSGKASTTHYQVLKEGEGLSLIKLRLETGRTHQIRVHLSHCGCPILGDYVYGKEDKCFSGRFALHSSCLSFVQPISGKEVSLISKVPDAWYTMLETVKGGSL